MVGAKKKSFPSKGYFCLANMGGRYHQLPTASQQFSSVSVYKGGFRPQPADLHWYHPNVCLLHPYTILIIGIDSG